MTSFFVPRDDCPRKVVVGRYILFAAMILFFVMAIVELVIFALGINGNSELFVVDWSKPTEVIKLVWRPFYSVILVLGGIGALSYLRNKGPFMSMVAFISFAMGVIAVLDLLRLINALVAQISAGQSERAIGAFFLDMLDVQIVGAIYFVGWFLTKDYLE